MHNLEDSDVRGLFPDSHGYKLKAGGKTYRTIMAYWPGITIPFFSNPDATFGGAPLGVAGQTNNAKAIRASAGFVSRYRNRKMILKKLRAVSKSKDTCWVSGTLPNKDTAQHVLVDVGGATEEFSLANGKGRTGASKFKVKSGEFSFRLRGAWPGEWDDERQARRILVTVIADGHRYEASAGIAVRKRSFKKTRGASSR